MFLDARAARHLERVSGNVRRLGNAQREHAAGRLLGLGTWRYGGMAVWGSSGACVNEVGA